MSTASPPRVQGMHPAPVAGGVAHDRRRNDTRARLITCATRLFAQKGYGATSVAEIEGAAGLRPGGGGLYRHFTSKDELLLGAVRAYAERVAELRATLASHRRAAPGSIADELSDVVSSLATFLAAEQPIIQLTADSASLSEQVRRAIGEAWNDGYGMIGDIFVEHGMNGQDASFYAASAIGSLNHFVTHAANWVTEPAGIALNSFLRSWIQLWSDIAAGVSPPQTSSRKSTISPA